MKHKYTLLVSLGIWIGILGFTLVRHKDDWGFFGHRRINRLAVFTLVPEMMPLFKTNIEFITEHAVDPDKRRYAVPGEAIRHYIDLDIWHRMNVKTWPKTYIEAQALLGDWVEKLPNGQLQSIFIHPKYFVQKGKKYLILNQLDSPRIDLFEYQRFLSNQFKAGLVLQEEHWVISDSLNYFFNAPLLPSGKPLLWIDTFSRHGILPFYIPQLYQKLVLAFKHKDQQRILRLASDMGHYIGDAHVPLHTTSNYNGQFTGQSGLHAFWESRIPELFADQTYDYLVGKANYIKDIETYIWDIVNTSHRYVDSVLLIEKRLSMHFPSDQQYCFDERADVIVKLPCEAYAAAYQKAMKGMVEHRMRAAILAVGSVWYSAWVDAGQPNLSAINELLSIQIDTLLEKAIKSNKALGRPEN